MTPLVVFRQASEADIPFLLECRNDPETRRQSRHGEVKDETWARGCVAPDGGRQVYVLDGPKGPVGTGDLRIDRHDQSGRAEVSLTVHPGARRAGYGATVLALLLQEARRLGHTSYAAFIKPGNTASLRLFEAAGFCQVHEWQTEGLLEFHK